MQGVSDRDWLFSEELVLVGCGELKMSVCEWEWVMEIDFVDNGVC